MEPIATRIDSRSFRDAMGTFATGVTVVTTGRGADVHAMTANSLTSVSLTPPLLLVCVDRHAKALTMMSKLGRFAVNILSKEQEGLSRYFANQRLDSTPAFAFSTKHTEAPILVGAMKALDCKVTQTVGAGDHVVFVGEVETILTGEGEPLCFYRGQYRELK